FVNELMNAYPISLALAEHLAGKYGLLAPGVLELSRENSELLSPITDGALPIQAEVVYSIRRELAASVEDILARRPGLQFVDSNMSLKAAPAVAAILARELGWNQATERDALDEYVAF